MSFIFCIFPLKPRYIFVRFALFHHVWRSIKIKQYELLRGADDTRRRRLLATTQIHSYIDDVAEKKKQRRERTRDVMIDPLTRGEGGKINDITACLIILHVERGR